MGSSVHALSAARAKAGIVKKVAFHHACVQSGMSCGRGFLVLVSGGNGNGEKKRKSKVTR